MPEDCNHEYVPVSNSCEEDLYICIKCGCGFSYSDEMYGDTGYGRTNYSESFMKDIGYSINSLERIIIHKKKTNERTFNVKYVEE